MWRILSRLFFRQSGKQARTPHHFVCYILALLSETLIMPTSTCQHCYAHFESRRSTAKYCSDRCRLAAHRGAARPLASVWLRKAAVTIAQDVFAPAGIEIDGGSFDVSFGYPIKMQRQSTRDGQVHYVGGVAIGTDAIVIPPQGDSLRVLDILVHEMTHITTPGDGHGRRFQSVADAVGLMPPYTATTAGPGLVVKLKNILVRLGAPPMPFDGRPSTRPAFQEKSDGTFVAVEIKEPWHPPRRTKSGKNN